MRVATAPFRARLFPTAAMFLLSVTIAAFGIGYRANLLWAQQSASEAVSPEPDEYYEVLQGMVSQEVYERANP